MKVKEKQDSIGLESQFYMFLAMSLWASHLIFLRLSLHL